MVANAFPLSSYAIFFLLQVYKQTSPANKTLYILNYIKGDSVNYQIMCESTHSIKNMLGQSLFVTVQLRYTCKGHALAKKHPLDFVYRIPEKI